MESLEMLLTIAGLWLLLYLAPALLLTIPIWVLGHHRVKWLWWEFAILVIPYLLFISLDALRIKGGLGYAMILGNIYLSGVVPVAALIRVLVGQRLEGMLVASSLLIAACAFTILLYLLLPPVMD